MFGESFSVFFFNSAVLLVSSVLTLVVLYLILKRQLRPHGL
jgi:hypothetical protein